MKQYLLDTHTLFWFLEGQPALSSKAKNIIEDSALNIFVSTVSLFKIAIKIKIGKFVDSFSSLDIIIQKTLDFAIIILPLSAHHISCYDKILFYEDHRDPFDQVILAIALGEAMPVISIDKKFDWYKDHVNIVW